MRLFYTIGIYIYTLGIRVAAVCGHEKARLMVRGWREWKVESGKWKVESGEWKAESGKWKVESGEWKVESGTAVAWFHAASLGEFEQARPVLEALRERHPDYHVLVTFFSPSGYEVRKNYALADKVMYLPMDTPRNARRMLDRYKPSIVFFVKYEFWFNYLGELRRRGIPTYLFSSIFRPDQYFFKWYGGWFRRQLKGCFTHLFVQNEESVSLLRGIGIDHCSLAGDTRFDRVHQIAVAAEGNEVVERWLAGHDGKVMVAGSTWPPDEELIAKLKVESGKWKVESGKWKVESGKLKVESGKLKVILAPHVINEEHLKQIEALFPDSIRYSQLSTTHSTLPTQSVLLIDNIGMLSKLYRYADVAYIGGGFGVGIHNILEAVTFGKPVLFGPNHDKFQEARDIVARGGGWSHRNADELSAHLTPLLSDPAVYAKASQACTDYMNENLGSTEKILSKLEIEN